MKRQYTRTLKPFENQKDLDIMVDFIECDSDKSVSKVKGRKGVKRISFEGKSYNIDKDAYILILSKYCEKFSKKLVYKN